MYDFTLRRWPPQMMMVMVESSFTFAITLHHYSTPRPAEGVANQILCDFIMLALQQEKEAVSDCSESRSCRPNRSVPWRHKIFDHFFFRAAWSCGLLSLQRVRSLLRFLLT